MKKYIIFAFICSLAMAATAYASFAPLPFNFNFQTHQTLKSIDVGTVKGDQVEITTYVDDKGALSYDSRDVTKELYASEITSLQKQIEAINAKIAQKQGLMAKLSY